MILQHEITRARALLDSNGNIAEPGFARLPLPIYTRRAVKAPARLLREWDYYLINNGRFALALSVAEVGRSALCSAAFFDLENLWQRSLCPSSPLLFGARHMPESPRSGDCAARGRDYRVSFRHSAAGRTLSFEMANFSGSLPIRGELLLTDEPPESLVVCTPFPRRGQFCFGQKINCMRAAGTVTVRGRSYVFEPETAFAALDWGRGAWSGGGTWLWATASGEADGVPFGFNLGCGLGDSTAATENALIFDGRVHKLTRVSFNIPRRAGLYHCLAPWTITSVDNRLELDFRPVLDHSEPAGSKLLHGSRHQVFGRFSGTAVLDNGRSLKIRDLPGMAEINLKKSDGA